jgi:hypothetical protein
MVNESVTDIRFEWRNEFGDPQERRVEWPSVPRVGEHVCVDDDTGEGYTVASVLWDAGGAAVVRLR